MKTQAQDIFLQAREMEPAAREAFIAGACGDDAGLQHEIQRMLVDADRADAFFGDTEGVTVGAAEFKGNLVEKEGDQIGSYKLRQQIGEGGFGVVWMAEQSIPISRMVALKVIKAGMDTQQVLARFEAERQALAMMDHPNIAKVLDAGATSIGRPWFAMELVKGIPITDYCDQAGLGINDSLELFHDVCAAIRHAHQKGIIHRDIKPSNVMVTRHGGKPVVKVIDFGIAKATQGKLTDLTLFTRFEQLIGTPVYMSPEQAGLSGLDIDTRSDIYSLGILLYELLVGKPPFDPKTLISAGYDEMRRIIREVEPVKPSSRLSTIVGEERTLLAKKRRVEEGKLTKLVEPDLDWIVMKAIEKDRTRRYVTADAFAEDIARFLSDQTVTATPPSAGYRFRKFARRNKGALRVATGITLLLIAATLVSGWQAVRATTAEKQALETLKEVATERDAKEKALKDAIAERDAKEKALKDAVAISKFLAEVFQSPDPRRDGRTITVAESLDNAAKKLETDLINQPETRAKLQFTLGKTYCALGLARQAIPLQEAARDYFLSAHGLEHADTLTVLGGLAGLYANAGRRDEAIKMQEEVLGLSRKVNGPEHPDTLGAMHNLALCYSHADRPHDAIVMQEELLTLSRKVNGPEHPDTITVMGGLADLFYKVGRNDEAIKMQEEMLAFNRRTRGPQHPVTLRAMHNLALSYSGMGRRVEGIGMQEMVLELSRTVNGPEHPDTLRAMNNLANSYSNVGRRDEAIRIQEQMLPLSRKINGPEHPDTLMAMNNLASSYDDAGRRDEAIKIREESLRLLRDTHGLENVRTLEAMHILALSYLGTGRRDEAIRIQEQVVPLRRNLLGLEHTDTIASMSTLALSYSQAGRRDVAIKLLEDLAPLLRKEKGPQDNALFRNAQLLAQNYQRTGRIDKAIKHQKEAVSLARAIHGPEDPETIDAMHLLAVFHSLADQPNEALKLREQVLPLRRKVLGLEHPNTLEAMNLLAISYQNTGRLAEARALRDEMAAIAAKNPQTPAP